MTRHPNKFTSACKSPCGSLVCPISHSDLGEPSQEDTLIAPLSPQPQRRPKNAAATLRSKPDCCMEPPRATRRERNASTRPHASSRRDRLVWEKCTPRNARPAPPSSPHSGPWWRAPRPGVPEPPQASPGRRVTFQVHSSSLLRGRSVSASSATPPLCGPGRAQLASAPPRRAHRAGSGLLAPPLALRGSRGRGGCAAGGRASWSCGDDVGCCRLAALRGPRREGGAAEGGGSSAERRDGGGRGSARRGVGEPGARFLEGGVTSAGANLYSGAGPWRRRRQSALYTPNLRSEAT